MTNALRSPLDRRRLLGWTAALSAASGARFPTALAQPGGSVQTGPTQTAYIRGDFRKKMIGYMLGHEQFTVPELLHLGTLASQAGFQLLATSDHFQPWQANEGHAGLAWVTLGALGAKTSHSWMGTTVTCPLFRYNPAVVAEAFASLSQLYPGRIFLGVGSGEALNEEAATGMWPKWQERWDRLVEALAIIRQLWTGQRVTHKGTPTR
jgi:F420-dependent hydroxymycolic acid dehydrogenase